MAGRLEQNPFLYGTPLVPGDAISREREVELVLRLALAGQNTRVSAPRGYGKTTLLAQARAAADDLWLNTVRVDLQGIRSAADVAGRLEHGFAAARGPVAGRVLRQAGLRAGGDVVRTPRDAPPARGEIAQRLLFELLDLPLTFYRCTRVRTLVIFDEFQDVCEADGCVEPLIRSCIQHHGRVASYVFGCSSSKMLSHRARPLALGPLSARRSASFIGKRFARSGRDPAPVLGTLLQTAGGHPQRMMLLAHHLWEHTPRGHASSQSAWQLALAAAYAELHEAFAAAWNGPDERSVLAAVAWGRKPLTAPETLQHFELTETIAEAALHKLIGSGQLVWLSSGELAFVDPLYRGWIAAGGRAPSAPRALQTVREEASLTTRGESASARWSVGRPDEPRLAVAVEDTSHAALDELQTARELRRATER